MCFLGRGLLSTPLRVFSRGHFTCKLKKTQNDARLICHYTNGASNQRLHNWEPVDLPLDLDLQDHHGIMEQHVPWITLGNKSCVLEWFKWNQNNKDKIKITGKNISVKYHRHRHQTHILITKRSKTNELANSFTS